MISLYKIIVLYDKGEIKIQSRDDVSTSSIIGVNREKIRYKLSVTHSHQDTYYRTVRNGFQSKLFTYSLDFHPVFSRKKKN